MSAKVGQGHFSKAPEDVLPPGGEDLNHPGGPGLRVELIAFLLVVRPFEAIADVLEKRPNLLGDPRIAGEVILLQVDEVESETPVVVGQDRVGLPDDLRLHTGDGVPDGL